MAELVSTRDPEAAPVSYTEALITGLAPDRGLYVPKGAEYPHFSLEEIGQLQGKTYAEVATAVKSRLIDGDIPLADQIVMNEAAYDPAAFPEAVDGNLTPVRQIGNNLFTHNLWLGPSAAFKDFPLRSVGQEVHHTIDLRDIDLDDAGATSGDTGVAAMEAFIAAALGRNRRVGMFIVSSSNGTMSAFQRAQMGLAAAKDEYTHNLIYDGSFDDCQDLIKEIKQDKEFSDLGAVNSINWGRITAQVVYQFYGYIKMVEAGHIKLGNPIDTLTPTGNFGNVFSDHAAREMGLPIRNSKLVTNENNVMHLLVQDGVYIESKKPHDTTSPSMDITKASNYERLVYEFFEGDAERTRAYMGEFEHTGRVTLEDHGLDTSAFEQQGIKSDSSTHADRLNAIGEVYQSSGDVIDPHTADAVAAALKPYGGKLADAEPDVPTLCRSTAAWYKFEDIVKTALNGYLPDRPAHFEGLEDMPGADTAVVIGSLEHLKAYIREHRH